MGNNKHSTKSLLQKPAFRIGVVVLVIHAVCWLGWSATQRDTNNNSASAVQANHEKIRAAIEK